MTITSYGYPGSVNKVGHALISEYAGAEYNVSDRSSGRVTKVTSGADRSVNVGVGAIFGRGVVDVIDAPVTVGPMPTVTSGSRWDLIVANRNFTSKTTTFDYVQGGPSKVLPTRLHSVTDGVDQQPLALVRFAAGSTLPQDVIDLRIATGPGGAYAFGTDTVVLDTIGRPGPAVRIGKVRWQATVDSSGIVTWMPETPTLDPMQFFGLGTAFIGGTPSGAPLLVQAGTIVRVSDNQGRVTQNFPKPFPNGVLTVLIVPGDDFSNADLTANLWGYTTNAFQYRVWGYPGAVPNTYPDRHLLTNYNHRVNYIAIGW